MSELEALAGKLTEAQRAMLLREPGRYQDCVPDVVALLEAEIWGTTLTDLGASLRAHLQAREALSPVEKEEGGG